MLHRLAVYLLFDEASSLVIRAEQLRVTEVTGDDLALRYPVHVTLRGPFWAEERLVQTVLDDENLWSGISGVELCLLSWEAARDDLLWRRVAGERAGEACLRACHREVSEALSSVIVRDDVLAAHQDSGYLPHVSIGWGAVRKLLRPESGPGAAALEVRSTRPVLARYPRGWPDEGEVSVMEVVR